MNMLESQDRERRRRREVFRRSVALLGLGDEDIARIETDLRGFLENGEDIETVLAKVIERYGRPTE